MKRNNGYVATVVMFFLMVMSIIALYAMNNVEIHINEPFVTLECGKEFQDDVTANIFGVFDVSKFVKKNIDGNLSKKGMSFINYTCFFKKEYRIVKVIDTKSPDIFLIGEDVVTVDDITDYREEGFFAYDEVDGNICHRASIVTLEKCDNQFEIVYLVNDYSGNWAEARRTVIVRHNEEIETDVPENSSKKEVYLTFDDGPSMLTPNYLDVLEAYGVNATFFVVGFEDEEDKAWKIPIMQRALNAGNVIALHGNSHEYSEIYQSSETATENFYIEHDVLQSTLGIDTKIIRFPGGASNTVSKNYCEGVMTVATKKVVEDGYNYVDWNVDSNDAGSDIENSEAIYKNVIDGVSYGTTNVVLMHDCGGHKATLEALPQIIETLQSEGYEFKVITSETEPVRHAIFN